MKHTRTHKNQDWFEQRRIYVSCLLKDKITNINTEREREDKVIIRKENSRYY